MFFDWVCEVVCVGYIELDLCVDLFGEDVCCKLLILVWVSGIVLCVG